MSHVKTLTRLVAVAAASMVLAGVLAPTSSSAQTPDAYLAVCSSSGAPLQPPAIPTDAQLQQWQTQFAQGLSQALNVPLATVQQAVAAQSSSPALEPPVAFKDPLTTVAAQLDVSVDSLLSAVQAADQTLPCPQGPGGAAPGPSGGNAIFIGTGGSGAGGPGPIDTGLGQEVSAAFYRGSGAGGPGPIDTTAFFGAVAKSLGQGFTGQQVQSAFASAAPPLPDPSTLTTDLQNQLNSLATVLGVSADTLKSALKSLASSGGCLPPNTLGGFRLAKQIAGGGAPRPSGAGVGPIIIPFAGSTPPRLPGNPGDPLGLGLTPCGINLRAS